MTCGRTDKILISLNPIPALHKHIPYPFHWMHVPEASANVFPSLFWFLAGYHSFCVLASLFPSPALGIFSLFKRKWGRNGSILGWNEKWWEMDCLNLNTPPLSMEAREFKVKNSEPSTLLCSALKRYNSIRPWETLSPYTRIKTERKPIAAWICRREPKAQSSPDVAEQIRYGTSRIVKNKQIALLSIVILNYLL